MRRRSRSQLLLTALAASACATNPFQQFYRGVPDARVMPGYQSSDSIRIYSTSDFTRDAAVLARRGYVVLGTSSFNSGVKLASESNLRTQAADIGAEAILVASRYTGNATGVVPLVIPQNITTSTTTSGGGSATSTTRFLQTLFLPYSVARANVGVMYLARVQGRLGVHVIDLDDTTRMRLQTNAGVRVALVVDGSPAFDADILPGDILLAIDAERVKTTEDFLAVLARQDARTVALTINRAGSEITKRVPLRHIGGFGSCSARDAAQVTGQDVGVDVYAPTDTSGVCRVHRCYYRGAGMGTTTAVERCRAELAKKPD